MTRTSFCLIFGMCLRLVRNMPPPSKGKTHGRLPRLDQGFDEMFPFLKSVEKLNAQNTVLTVATEQNKMKYH